MSWEYNTLVSSIEGPWLLSAIPRIPPVQGWNTSSKNDSFTQILTDTTFIKATITALLKVDFGSRSQGRLVGYLTFTRPLLKS